MKEDFVYTPATTDVTIRWRKIYNWVPPSEDPIYQQKWANFRAMMAKGVEAFEPPQPKLSKPRLINAGKVINYD